MSFELLIGLIGLLAYLLGSLSFAILVSRMRGLSDPEPMDHRIPVPPTSCAVATRWRLVSPSWVTLPKAGLA